MFRQTCRPPSGQAVLQQFTMAPARGKRRAMALAIIAGFGETRGQSAGCSGSASLTTGEPGQHAGVPRNRGNGKIPFCCATKFKITGNRSLLWTMKSPTAVSCSSNNPKILVVSVFTKQHVFHGGRKSRATATVPNSHGSRYFSRR